MGADFCFAIIPVCKVTPEREAKLKLLVEDLFKDHDEDEFGHTKEDVLSAVDSYADSFDCHREVGTMTIRGAAYYITGGMTWGDSPTEAYDELSVLDELFEQLEEWSLEDNKK